MDINDVIKRYNAKIQLGQILIIKDCDALKSDAITKSESIEKDNIKFKELLSKIIG